MSDTDKICFVIAPIGPEGSNTRTRSDDVFELIIKRAVEPFGYTAIRADHISDPGMITHQVINHLVNDDLVIADLTEVNPNVFYELAVRHAAKKPFIHIIELGEAPPFDVWGMRTISYDLGSGKGTVNAQEAIINQIKIIESGNAVIQNPITNALALQSLQQSENQDEKTLADLFKELSDLRAILRTMYDNIDDLRFMNYHEDSSDKRYKK